MDTKIHMQCYSIAKCSYLMSACIYFYIAVDVSAQSCTITPINPTTLTATGGVLASGTENVTIRCNCTDDKGGVLDNIIWYNPDTTKLPSYNRYVVDVPYYRRELDDNITLVIPTFNDSYGGTYTCGIKYYYYYYLPGPLNATINLTIGGELQ